MHKYRAQKNTVMYKEIQCALSRCTYQGQHEVEKGSATVEEDGQQRGNRGKQQAHIPAHDNPQGLQDLIERTAGMRTNPHEGSSSGVLWVHCLPH